MIKHVLSGAFGAMLALGAGSAMAYDPHGAALQQQTDVRAHEAGDNAHDFAHDSGHAVRNTGRTIVHGTQTAFEATHAAEHNVRHPDDERGADLSARRQYRAAETRASARSMAHATGATAQDTGGVVVHGAETTGDAIHQGAHNVRRGVTR